MISISRAFFFSLGTVMFLVLGLFWIGLALDFSALENFLVQLCYSHLIGFTIPQILGSQSTDSIVQQVFLLKIICTIVVILYGAFFFFVGTIKAKRLKLQSLYCSIIAPVTLFLFYVWYKLISEDHILLQKDKIELSQFTIISFATVVVLIVLSLKKERNKGLDALSSKIPTVDDLKNDIDVSSNETRYTKDSNLDKETPSGSESPKQKDEEGHQSPNNKDKEPNLNLSEANVTGAGAEKDEELPPPSDAPAPDNTEGKIEENADEEQDFSESTDDDLPPPPAGTLPPDLAELQQEKNEDGENSESVDDDLPPPSADSLPPDLAKLQEEKNDDTEQDSVEPTDPEPSQT